MLRDGFLRFCDDPELACCRAEAELGQLRNENAQLRSQLRDAERRERAAVEAIRKSLRDERVQRPHLNRCSQCAKAIKDNSQRKYKFGCESLCPEALRVIVGCGFKIYEPLIPFAEDWRGPQEAGNQKGADL